MRFNAFGLILAPLFLSLCHCKKPPVSPSKYSGETGVILNSHESCDGVNLLSVHLDGKYISHAFDMDGTSLGQIPGLFPQFFEHRVVFFTEDHAVMINDNGEIKKTPVSFVHHDATSTKKSVIFIDSNKTTKDGKTYLTDRVRILDEELNETRRIDFSPGKSLKEILKVKGLKTFDFHYEEGRQAFAVTHLNSAQIIPKNALSDKFAPLNEDNILISCRKHDVIGIIGPSSDKLIWSYTAEFGMHSPRVLPSGNILIFMNNKGRRQLGSYLIELDPQSKQVVREYRSQPPERFHNDSWGSSIPLCKGNTLVTHVTDGGAAFEVTNDGKIVWEWFNPNTSEGKPQPVYRVERTKREYFERFKNFF